MHVFEPSLSTCDIFLNTPGETTPTLFAEQVKKQQYNKPLRAPFMAGLKVNTERQYKYLQYVINTILIRYFSLCEGEAAQISNKRRQGEQVEKANLWFSNHVLWHA